MRTIRKILKICAWTVMAAVLAIAATAICIVKLISPEQLTPIVEKAVNSMLDARVSIGRVELDFHNRAPFVKLRVDSLLIISEPMIRLRAEGRTDIPARADTLLTMDCFEGSVNLMALLSNKLDLRDITFTGPAVNIFTVDEGHSNYLIYTSSGDTDESEGTPMAIALNEFRIVRPGPIRFTNMATGEHFQILLSSFAINGEGAPVYNLDLGGDVDSPTLGLYNLDKLNFGVRGGIGWDSEKPTELELNKFKLIADFLEATVSAHVDFGRDIVVKDFDLELGEMSIDRVLSVIPDSIRGLYDISPRNFSTGVALSFTARSTAPFNLTTDSIPSADMTLRLVPGDVRFGRARFSRVGGTITASLRGNDLNAATFGLHDFLVQGPATDLTVNCTATRILDDPQVSGRINGRTDLQRLPRQLADRLQGSLSGLLTLDLEFEGSPSMISRDSFHRLHVRGDLDGHRLYYLANDTNLMLYADNTCVKFGTNERLGRADSLLTGRISIDSLNIIQGDAGMTITGLTLGVGASNRHASADTTAIIPMGGGLKISTFDLELFGHSTTVKIRDVDGRVTMKRFKNHTHLPQFDFNLGIRFASFGSPDSRMMLSGSELLMTAHKMPRGERLPPKVRHTADSLRTVHPEMPLDSVYAYAIRKHRPNRRHRPRVHPEYTEEESEIIYWGTTDLVKKLLLEWDIRGSIKSRRAGMFTASFPIRNRIRNLNATFTTDSVVLTDVQYKVGSSDFLISGRISNMRRGFTSRGFRRPLRINFDVVSDTIDINEIAGTAFRGAAVAEAARQHERDFNLDALEREEAAADSILEHELGRMVADAPDSVAPLLIPSNIDLRLNMRANNVKYSDLMFNDFSGELLAANGALNLNRLAASSEMGSVEMSALYSAPRADDLRFGFGLKVDKFNIGRFTRLVPAVDSIMPMLRDIRGIINADIAATCDIDRKMNLELPTLAAAIRIEGDSLEIIDKETYRTIGKWLMFKDRQRNIIDHMDVRMTVSDNRLQLYPVIFTIDRYRLGVQGYNDLSMNFDYHIAVLKSPLPFKFGVNIKGNPDKYKIRLGKARLNENLPVDVAIVDTTRVNLLRQIENVFRRGVASSDFRSLRIAKAPEAASIDLSADTISAADSAAFIREGLIPAPEPPAPADTPRKKGRGKQPKTGADRPGNREAKEND